MKDINLNTRSSAECYSAGVSSMAASNKKVVPLCEKTMKTGKIAANVFLGLASAAAGAYTQVSLGHPQGMLVSVPLMQLLRIGAEGKVQWLRRLELANFISGQAVAMMATGINIVWNGIEVAPMSWTEKAYYATFAVSCIAAAEVAIQYAKAKQKVEQVAKVGA